MDSYFYNILKAEITSFEAKKSKNNNQDLSNCNTREGTPEILSFSLFNEEENSKYKKFSLETVKKCLSSALINASNEDISLKRTKLNVSLFDAVGDLSISLDDYIDRLIKLTEISDNTFLYSVILLERLLNSQIIKITNKNMHKVIFISLILSIKLNEDKNFKFKYYAIVSGISTKEITLLEKEYLKIIKNKAHVKETEFNNFYNNLFDYVEKKEDKFSYCDISYKLEQLDINECFNNYNNIYDSNSLSYKGNNDNLNFYCDINTNNINFDLNNKNINNNYTIYNELNNCISVNNYNK